MYMQKDVLLRLVSRAIAVKGSWMLKKDEVPGSRVRPFSGFCLAIRQGTDVFYTQYLHTSVLYLLYTSAQKSTYLAHDIEQWTSTLIRRITARAHWTLWDP